MPRLLAPAALAGALCLGLAGAALRAAGKPEPLVSVMGTCSALTPNTYPADTMTWFDAGKQPQVVFYAHLLFPVQPEPGSQEPVMVAGPCRLSATVATAQALTPTFSDDIYAQAEWLDPDGKRVAFYGLTFPARIRSDYVKVLDRWYAPHTFAMAIGTKDLRGAAGQLLLPDKIGQYYVRLSVEGRAVGLAFFRMLKGASAGMDKASAPLGASPSAAVLDALGKAAAVLEK
jgi:hypothetical protein